MYWRSKRLRGGSPKLPNEARLHEDMEELEAFSFVLDGAVSTRNRAGLE